VWRSFADFDERCSMRTWVFRVAHNTGVTHVIRERRRREQLKVSLKEVEEMPAPSIDSDREQRLSQLHAMSGVNYSFSSIRINLKEGRTIPV
jgi:DNA-directed RNA polymerase specialized sigma24 family protein